MYIAILIAYRKRCRGFFAPISVYHDIVFNIGYKSDSISAKNPISEVARRVTFEISGTISYPISKKTPISGQFFTISEVARRGMRRYVSDIVSDILNIGHDIRYRDQKHYIVIFYADIELANIGFQSDNGFDIGSSSDIGTNNLSFRQVLLPGTNTIIAMIMTAITVGIERWTKMSCAIISTKILT